MTHACAPNFETIESAQDYVKLLAETVAEAKNEIERDICKEQTSDLKSRRRLEALRLVSYSLEKLAFHTKKSCRILNDLRSMRRLLFEERKAAPATSNQLGVPKAGIGVTPVRASAPAATTRSVPGTDSVVAA